MGARVFRVDRAAAAEFSFFLAIPTMLGATVYDLYKNWSTLDWHGGGVIALGFVAAFLSAAASWSGPSCASSAGTASASSPGTALQSAHWRSSCLLMR